jgi:hypothetical protein
VHRKSSTISPSSLSGPKPKLWGDADEQKLGDFCEARSHDEETTQAVEGGLFCIPSDGEQGIVGVCFLFEGENRRRLEQLRHAGAITVNMGDYILIWIDSFGSNTAQGGYETLCVEEASLRKLKQFCP